MSPICCGLTLVPMVSPSAPAVKLASATTTIRNGQLLTCATGHRARRVHRGARVHAWNHVGENKEEKQRIHADADRKRKKFTSQNVEIAHKKSGECPSVLHSCRTLSAPRHPSWSGFEFGQFGHRVSVVAVYSRRSRPVSRMKTVSRLVSVIVRSRRP